MSLIAKTKEERQALADGFAAVAMLSGIEENEAVKCALADLVRAARGYEKDSAAGGDFFAALYNAEQVLGQR